VYVEFVLIYRPHPVCKPLNIKKTKNSYIPQVAYPLSSSYVKITKIQEIENLSLGHL